MMYTTKDLSLLCGGLHISTIRARARSLNINPFIDKNDNFSFKFNEKQKEQILRFRIFSKIERIDFYVKEPKINVSFVGILINKFESISNLYSDEMIDNLMKEYNC